MSSNTVGSATPSVTDRVDQVAKRIAQHEAAISSSSRTMGVVGLIALLLLTGYFYYGYTMISELLEPSKLIPLGTNMLADRMPEARQAMVKQVSDSAPGWANQVSTQLRGGIPAVRQKMETYVLKQTDDLLSQVTNLTEEKFQTIIKDNRDIIENGLKELATSEKMSEASLDALVKVLEQALEKDMKAQAEAVLETLRHLRGRVGRLQSGIGLDQEEKIERRVLMLARRLQLTEADPTPIKAPEVPELKPAKKAEDAEKSDSEPKADVEKPDDSAKKDAKEAESDAKPKATDAKSEESKKPE